MATVSVRVDDDVKAAAEKVADEIGMSLSTAVNIFLKKFATEEGFPFDVNASKKNDIGKFVFDRAVLEPLMKKAVSEANIQSSLMPTDHFTYFDHSAQKPVIAHIQK